MLAYDPSAGPAAFDAFLISVREHDFDHTIDELGETCALLEALSLTNAHQAGRLYAVLCTHHAAFEVPEYLDPRTWLAYLERHEDARQGFVLEAPFESLKPLCDPRRGKHDLSAIAALLASRA